MTTMTAQTTQIYELFIRATPEEIWQAITQPEFTVQYFYGSRVSVTPDAFRTLGDAGADPLVWGSVTEFDPPHRLAHGWRALYDSETAAEEESRVTWEIEPKDGGVCLLRVVHDQLEGAPKTAASVAGGWMYILSGLKTVVETGRPLEATA